MYIKPLGQPYEEWLTQLHSTHLFDWYMEIGCRTGRTFAPSRSKTIAVDPFFKANSNIITDKPALHVFQQPSDDFFASGFLARNDVKLSFTFIDGMHLIEYALRDLIGVEANSLPGSIIALHDCCPFNQRMTTRDLDNLPKWSWTGDVWKILPILRRYRPDLKVTVLDCSPTGLVLLSQLDPENRVLAENMDAILAEYQEVDIETYGVAKFYESFSFVRAKRAAKRDFPLFANCRIDETAALKPQFVRP